VQVKKLLEIAQASIKGPVKVIRNPVARVFGMRHSAIVIFPVKVPNGWSNSSSLSACFSFKVRLLAKIKGIP
jgi:hypothetical protein